MKHRHHLNKTFQIIPTGYEAPHNKVQTRHKLLVDMSNILSIQEKQAHVYKKKLQKFLARSTFFFSVLFLW